jgi:transcriptional regulator with XRE-family HTH domain
VRYSANVSEESHDIGGFIREQRTRSKMSLRRLAEKAGISNPYLSQIERGLRKPSAEILKSLARGLSIQAESLYIQAGLLDDSSVPPTVRAALEADESLSHRQKQVLLDLYRTMVETQQGEVT